MHVYQPSRFLVSYGDANIENFLFWENGEVENKQCFVLFCCTKNENGAQTFSGQWKSRSGCVSLPRTTAKGAPSVVAASPWKTKSLDSWSKTLGYTKIDSVSFNDTVFLFFFLFLFHSIVCSSQGGIWKALRVLKSSFFFRYC